MRIDIPKTNQKRVVVIGAGFAGIEVCKQLKKSGYQIVLLDKHNYHTFQPLLYQVATSGLAPDSIAYPIRKIFKKYKDFYYRMVEVKDLLPEENKIITSIGDVEFDYLVIATGAKTNFFNNESLSIASMPMKSVKEALNLRSLILQNMEKALTIQNDRKKESLMNYVIVGAGPTGVELAGAIAEMRNSIFPKDYPELDCSKMKIIIVQSNERVLPALSEKSSARALKYLQDLGVEVKLKTRVLDYHGDYIQTNVEEDFISKTLIWTAGVQGNPVGGLFVNKGNRIRVDEFNRAVGYKNIFATGDVACMESEDLPRGHPMVAPVAVQQGKNVGKNLKRALKNKEEKAFSYRDKGSMATIGKNKAVVEVGSKVIGGRIAWFMWMIVHLLSLVGFANRIITLLNWTKNYFSSDRALRLIINPFETSKEKKKRKQKLEDLNVQHYDN